MKSLITLAALIKPLSRSKRKSSKNHKVAAYRTDLTSRPTQEESELLRKNPELAMLPAIVPDSVE